ncbi:hypothetical protein JCM8547_007965 [Rhodosporidiobolus lusitaniae]
MSTRTRDPSSVPCDQPQVCEDLLLTIFEELPSRTLVKLRGVSLQFAVLVDEILRTRFRELTSDEANTIVIESCAPYETRSSHCQPMLFSHFGPATDLLYTGGSVAHFKLAANPPVSNFLPFDEGQFFEQNILSIHLRNAPKPKASSDQQEEEEDVELAPPPTMPLLPQFDYSLSLASSLDRLFRSYFESSPTYSQDFSPSASPAESRQSSPPPPFSPSLSSCSSSPRPTRSHRLACPYNPSSSSALLAAQIECYQVPSSGFSSPSAYDSDDSLVSYSSPSSSPSSYCAPGTRSGSLECTSPPRLFEFWFSSCEMDVGKIVVAAEEGLPGGGRRTMATSTRGDAVMLVL